MATSTVVGFVGLGVMGEPMCRNLARKSGCRVMVMGNPGSSRSSQAFAASTSRFAS